MGEVYRARDTRLDRAVAIKVLPETAAGRADLRERLAREAKAVSSLNHPNICALYDVGHDDGTDYLVMEFLEGETLESRLCQGSLPVEELLRAAIEIADALVVAHRQGLIHRDLKPGNIMLTAAGPKLLDFGLAKVIEPTSADSGLTAIATEASPLTAKGTIVGTFQYMAPEQLEGREADARSDVFAFGTVLYEMASGRRAFEAQTHAGLIASIIKEQPRPLSELAPTTPPALQRLVRNCLEKDPDARRQTMNDVLLDLRWIAEGGSQAGVPAPVARRRRGRERIAWIAAVLGIVAAATFALLWQQATREPERVVVSSIVAPPGRQLDPDAGIALSPDGMRLVYIASESSGQPSLWVHRLNETRGQQLAGTAGGAYPFWSPDGTQIGFFADRKLKRISAQGGTPRTLADAPDARGGTWNRDDVIVFTPNFRTGLYRVAASGGTAEPLTEPSKDRGETNHRWPSFLPDGQRLLFLAQTHEGGSRDDQSRIEVVDLRSGERTALFAANSSVQYVSAGYVLFASQGALQAQPFEAASGTLTGDFVSVADKVHYTGNELAVFSASNAGMLSFHAGEGSFGKSRLVWYDRQGNRLGEPIVEGNVLGPRISNDGQRVVYEQNRDIWVTDLRRGTSTRLTFDAGDEFCPIWSPDDRWILYGTNRTREGVLERKLSSGLGSAEALIEAPYLALPMDWSSRAGAINFIVQDPEMYWDNWLYSVADKTSTPLIKTPFGDGFSRFSPDGEWLAYTSLESGRFEIYVQHITGPGGRWQISTSGGILPLWSRDGTEIFYCSRDGELMVVDVDLGDDFHAGHPEKLFDISVRFASQSVDPALAEAHAIDVAPDGQSFIVNEPAAARSVGAITLIQNWPATLGKRR
jgi:Tol biopolymer transport system component